MVKLFASRLVCTVILWEHRHLITPKKPGDFQNIYEWKINFAIMKWICITFYNSFMVSLYAFVVNHCTCSLISFSWFSISVAETNFSLMSAVNSIDSLASGQEDVTFPFSLFDIIWICWGLFSLSNSSRIFLFFLGYE